MQIHMKSDRGEIEVFLCPEEEALSHFGTSASVLTSEESATEDNDSDAAALPSPIKIKQEVNDHLDSTPTNRAFSTPNQMAASNHQTWEEGDDQAIKNVLIFESEDLGPIGNRFQQQTVDQEHHGKHFSIFACIFLKNFQIAGYDGGNWDFVSISRKKNMKIYWTPVLLLSDAIFFKKMFVSQ